MQRIFGVLPDLVKLWVLSEDVRVLSKKVLRSMLVVIGVAAVAGACVWIWLWQARQPDTSLRRARVQKVDSTIVIDGVLDDKAWASTQPTQPFILSMTGRPAPRECTARLAWNNEALYVGFSAVDNDIESPHEQRDDDLYTKDVVELFLDPDGDGLNYYEFEVSPRGVIFDALFASHRNDLPRSRRWNGASVEGAAVRVDGGWTAELKVPWSDIKHAPHSPPRVGDEWRGNLFRVDVHPESGDFTAWTAPLRGDFHALDRFGTLVFVD